VKVLILFLALFLMVSFASAQERSEAEDSKLIALENAWNQAQLRHDGKALERLVGEKFVYTDYDGTVMNRGQFLADIKDPSYYPTLMTNENMRVYFYDKTAVVIGTYHAKGTAQGKPFDHVGRFTDTWVLQDGNWQCVASHTNLNR